MTRVMALPQVEAFLQAWFPWLAAAEPARPQHRRDAGAVDLQSVLVLVVVVFVIVATLVLLGALPMGR